ncbi:uncharacterized protein EAE98_006119 [Botrytis deweyae]|uniref:Hydrophobin n=1 Tax=Botrytis deweyae TaxID=2478750 RepID=A0ABQ7IMM8_9HELO|nr:uncharacterized protein EAE98_006119 [Botrytis deweyae]KAF7911922.1 hypothetical protein EAE99_010930 [Botrytis elliptica]KAF7927737.1 hypothetical protein EAE98_006119 [Botrytis deweyae]
MTDSIDNQPRSCCDTNDLTCLNQQPQSQSQLSTIDVDIEASCLLIVSLSLRPYVASFNTLPESQFA